MAIDGLGIYGAYFHFSMVSFFFLSALLVFIVMRRKGMAPFDESPKYEIFKDDL